MIEMTLRAFTDLDGNLEPAFKGDGSAHTFGKQQHLLQLEQFGYLDPSVKITTPIYPFEECQLPDVLLQFERSCATWSQDKKILIFAADKPWAEINLLFQYYKICQGLNLDLDIFGGKSISKNISNWNAEYTHWRQMRTWEYREWFSIFYPDFIKEWFRPHGLERDDFLMLSNQQILQSTTQSLTDIINFCGLTLQSPIDDYVLEFQHRQQYVLDEYDVINKIVHRVLAKEPYCWPNLSIISEAILQNRFRSLGYEWYCDGLDILPTDSIEFADIIFPITKDPDA